MNDLQEKLHDEGIRLAIKMYSFIKWLKLLLACVICVAYFMDSSWLLEVIVFAVVFMLVLPLGFFDTYVEKLLEYNAHAIEERVLLNAAESTKAFVKFSKNINDLYTKFNNFGK